MLQENDICTRRFPSQNWIVADRRDMGLGTEFNGIIAWDSFFHLTPENQRSIFPLFRKHSAPNAALLFTSGPVGGIISTKLHRHYERTGQAVRIARQRVVAQFSQGLPAPMLAARLTFFITVAIMIVFGVAPVADSTARIGIIACVFALVDYAPRNENFVLVGLVKQRS